MEHEADRPTAQPKSPPTRRDDELDREPGSNRGRRGQMRESRDVARSAEEEVQTMTGHDDPHKSDRADK